MESHDRSGEVEDRLPDVEDAEGEVRLPGPGRRHEVGLRLEVPEEVLVVPRGRSGGGLPAAVSPSRIGLQAPARTNSREVLAGSGGEAAGHGPGGGQSVEEAGDVRRAARVQGWNDGSVGALHHGRGRVGKHIEEVRPCRGHLRSDCVVWFSQSMTAALMFAATSPMAYVAWATSTKQNAVCHGCPAGSSGGRRSGCPDAGSAMAPSTTEARAACLTCLSAGILGRGA
mmetsp:Transcript_80206/g.248941  ORF Transcript_80206/g.248941 Transcript_80206/m.248941 type:complete len:228 (-) Transcript_80206:33-716(-)